jgi:hypothetical protein
MLRQVTHGFSYWARGPSNANLNLLDILTYLGSGGVFRIKAYIDALGYKSFASLEISHYYGLPM